MQESPLPPDASANAQDAPEAAPASRLRVVLTLIASLYGVLLAIGLVGGGFKWATGGQAAELFEFASNPFLGLVIGTVATALIQSSSTVSSITVGLVGGGLPVATAVPIIMGANMGTTITNTLVSLGHAGKADEFRRAFAAATVHDFFNLLSVVVFLPLELLFHPLERIGGALAELTSGSVAVDASNFNVVKAITAPVVGVLKDVFDVLPQPFAGMTMALLGVALIFGTLSQIGRLLKQVLVGRAKQALHAAIGKGPIRGILSGTAVTALVQSSSTTTSLVVPLAGAGVFSVRDIYPFILGANIGTCVTALIAAMGVTGPHHTVAMQIALVHMTYNVLGVIVLYGAPPLRDVPIRLAEGLAKLATDSKLYVVAYVVGVFFLLPLTLIALLG